jgi:chemotaxis response regulator CheB
MILNHSDITCVGTASDDRTAQNEILKLKPDIILFEKDEDTKTDEAMAILGSSSWNIRIVLISLLDNQACLYQREEKTVVKINDLLSLVLDELPLGG